MTHRSPLVLDDIVQDIVRSQNLVISEGELAGDADEWQCMVGRADWSKLPSCPKEAVARAVFERPVCCVEPLYCVEHRDSVQAGYDSDPRIPFGCPAHKKIWGKLIRMEPLR